ncbi:hypothetical protein, partial [Mesorhizobium sp. M4A.F.Ca.ET.050.02.1.1]
MVAMVAMLVSAAQAARVAGTATTAAPQVVGLGFGAADGLVRQRGSGHGRHRDSGEQGISQKGSHLKSPGLVSVRGCVAGSDGLVHGDCEKFWEGGAGRGQQVSFNVGAANL